MKETFKTNTFEDKDNKYKISDINKRILKPYNLRGT